MLKRYNELQAFRVCPFYCCQQFATSQSMTGCLLRSYGVQGCYAEFVGFFSFGAYANAGYQ